jgi:hypothetical protein
MPPRPGVTSPEARPRPNSRVRRGALGLVGPPEAAACTRVCSRAPRDPRLPHGTGTTAAARAAAEHRLRAGYKATPRLALVSRSSVARPARSHDPAGARARASGGRKGALRARSATRSAARSAASSGVGAWERPQRPLGTRMHVEHSNNTYSRAGRRPHTLEWYVRMLTLPQRPLGAPRACFRSATPHQQSTRDGSALRKGRGAPRACSAPRLRLRRGGLSERARAARPPG